MASEVTVTLYDPTGLAGDEESIAAEADYWRARLEQEFDVDVINVEIEEV